MNRYVRWAMRRLKGQPRSRRRYASPDGGQHRLPAKINPRDLQPPVPTFGLDIEAVREWFSAISIDHSAPGELAGYARQDLERFLRTVDLVPINAKTCIEIGSNPYFTTTLLAWLRPNMRLFLTNFFGGLAGTTGEQTISVESPTGMQDRMVSYVSLNVETEAFPFPSDSVDVILYCEVLEHMTNDPMATLLEIARVLKSDGTLVLTTPNAARIENVTRSIAGLSTQDQYSGYGPYGRHNREYTTSEVRELLSYCGFVEEKLYTADVHPNDAALFVREPERLVDLCQHRAADLGQYIFSRWRLSERPIPEAKPAWLYRSYPSEQLDHQPLREPEGARF